MIARGYADSPLLPVLVLVICLSRAGVRPLRNVLVFLPESIAMPLLSPSRQRFMVSLSSVRQSPRGAVRPPALLVGLFLPPLMPVLLPVCVWFGPHAHLALPCLFQ